MGVFDKVLKKEPTEEELQAKEDLMMKSSEERYEEQANSQPVEVQPSVQSADRTVLKLEKDVELLKVQIELLKQSKQVSDERFGKFSEQIGEMRATVLDSERDGAQIKMQAEKAVELIQMVQPERLMNNVKKLEMRIDATKAIEEKVTLMQQKLVDELKDLRQKTEAIRGSDTILKLNEQVQRELSTAMQVQAKMEQRADKVEAIYADLQQHFFEYQKVFDRIKELDNEFKDISKEFNIFKVKVEGAASKSDFLKLKGDLKEYGNELDSKIIEVDKAVAKSEMMKADLKRDLDENMEEAKAEITKKVETVEHAAEKVDSLKAELIKGIASENAAFKKDFESRVSQLEDFEAEMKKGEKLIEGLQKDMKELEESSADTEKSFKRLDSMEKDISGLESMKSEFEKRIRTVETKWEELVNRASRKLDSVVSDTADNTSVMRDLVKEVYGLKTHSANILTRNDLTGFQKNTNEKLISFDMSLIKLEHHMYDLEQTFRSMQKEYSQQQKELKNELEQRIKQLRDLEDATKRPLEHGRDIA
ncbi:MAG: hypothetical protein V1658_00285 [Candidatus Micrarchaeota archaeon]